MSKSIRYVVCIGNERPSGLRIMPSEQYLQTIGKTPGLQHENMGDLYSSVSLDDLPHRIQSNLQQTSLEKKELFELISESEYQAKKTKLESNLVFIVSGQEGVLLTKPSLEKENVEYAPRMEQYAQFAKRACRNLFSGSTGPKGSFQREYEQLFGENT